MCNDHTLQLNPLLSTSPSYTPLTPLTPLPPGVQRPHPATQSTLSSPLNPSQPLPPLSNTHPYPQVCNDHTLQLNVSGAMMRSFSHVYNLITTIIEELQAPGQGLVTAPGTGLAPAPGQGLATAPGQGLATAPGTGLVPGSGTGLGQDTTTLPSIAKPLSTAPPPTTTYGATLTDKSLASGSDSPVTFHNCLEFPLEVFDALTREPLVYLKPGTPRP